MGRIVIVFFVIFFISFGIYTTWRTHDNSTDFDTYYYAAKDAASGSSVYTEHEDVSPYIYPPFFACLIAPLTVFNLEIASFIWYILSLGFFFLSILLCFNFVFGRENIENILRSVPLVPRVLFLIVIAGFFLDNISMLQVNILLCFLVLGAFYFFRKERAVLAGAFLAMAISIKIIPSLFLLYFIVKREFKICIFTIFWMLIFFLVIPSCYLGIENAWQSLMVWNEHMLTKSTSFVPNFDMIINMFNPENQSITAFLSRWLIKNDFLVLHFKRMAHEYPAFITNWTFSVTNVTALYISKVVIFLIVAITFSHCFRKIKDRTSPLLNCEYSLIFLLSLIANPVLKTQQIILVIFPLIFLLSHIAKPDKDYKFSYSAFICFSLLYLLQMGRIFKIFGFGTLSILWLWYVILLKYRKLLHHSFRNA